MRVLVVTPTFGAFGGLETYVFGLADAAATDAEIEMRVVLKAPSARELRPEMQQAIDACPVPVFIVRSGSNELRKHIEWADLVHAQNFSADVGALIRLTKTPLVITVHGHRPGRMPARLLAGEKACGTARARWYNSHYTLRSWEPDGPRPGSSVISLRIPQGVEPLPPADRRGFVFAARWIANKGLDTLLNAYEQADLDRESWPLVLLGDGPLRATFQQQIDDLAPHVTAPGFVSTERRTDVIRRARWLVAPANTNEDLGLTPLEARELGVPCIVTRDGGLQEAAGPFSLHCAPGRTDELEDVLKFASTLCEGDYAAMSAGARRTLDRDFAPLSVHLSMYMEMLTSGVTEVGDL